ncbi:MAG: hypothetical protein ACYTGL_30645, partial [Planctomycetota bacterium]
ARMAKLAPQCHSHPLCDRRGSTLLVVIALMGMLTVLGLMFFTFASQEKENAENFEAAGKVIANPSLDADRYFDWGLEQLIVGPNSTLTNSALWGGRWSMLPNAYGTDAHPHTGTGLNVVQVNETVVGVDANGNGTMEQYSAPFVDQNRDGIADFISAGAFSPLDPLNVNDSPAANIGFQKNLNTLPEPDVGYTYPDINTQFLAYRSNILISEPLLGQDVNGDGDTTDVFQENIVMPSFWRPQLYQRPEADFDGDSNVTNEDANGNGILDPGEDTNGNGFLDTEDFNGDGSTNPLFAMLDPGWYWRSEYQARTFRAHPDHIDANTVLGLTGGIPVPTARYLNEADSTDASIISGSGLSGGFPFSGPKNPFAVASPPSHLQLGGWQAWNWNSNLGTRNIGEYTFDADNDADGIPEGILMDLDFPAQERPSDGLLYTPMFSFTVYDADGLLNLNAHGNLSGDTDPPAANPSGEFGDGFSISQSNHGLAPSEINPLWAIDATPGFEGVDTAGGDYLAYFGKNPTTRLELANMEWWWANKGRLDFTSGGTDPEVRKGRYGEANRTWRVWQEILSAGGGLPIEQPRNLFPFPGVWNIDDNRNRSEDGFEYRDPSSQVYSLGLGQSLPFVTPLSFSGSGINYFINASSQHFPKLLDLYRPTTLSGVSLSGAPNVWPRFTAYGTATTDVVWNQLGLMRSTIAGVQFQHPDGTLADDPLELTLEPRFIKRPIDEPFTEADSAPLHLSGTDQSNTGVTTRLTALMPNAIDPTSTNQAAENRRKRFTTTSWDRKQFSLPLPFQVGADGEPGEAGVDDNQNRIIDDAAELGWPGTDDTRAWEFNADVDGDRLREFPPEFGLLESEAAPQSAYYSASLSPASAYYGFHPERPWDTSSFGSFTPFGPTCIDPFRPQLRRLLEVELGNRDELKFQFRLSINRILDVVRRAQTAGHPYESALEFRPLTPHITTENVTVTDLPTRTIDETLPPFPPRDWNGYSAAEVQEFWARYDRQRMARDIYVILYTLCGGTETRHAASPVAAAGTNYTGPQRREMAQFAVNLVDALDRDSVSTVFEYDSDLGDGWNLDDQFWTAESGQRRIVVGVESQELSFSESLWVHQPPLTNDNSLTPFDESAGDPFNFLFTELRSTSPAPVPLASSISSNKSNAIWRVRWEADAGNSEYDFIPDNDVPSVANTILLGETADSVDTNDSGSLDANLSNGNAVYF